MPLLAVAWCTAAIIILLSKESTSAPKMFLVKKSGSDGSTKLHLVKTKDKAIKTSEEEGINNADSGSEEYDYAAYGYAEYGYAGHDYADSGSEENGKVNTDSGSDKNKGQDYAVVVMKPIKSKDGLKCKRGELSGGMCWVATAPKCDDEGTRCHG